MGFNQIIATSIWGTEHEVDFTKFEVANTALIAIAAITVLIIGSLGLGGVLSVHTVGWTVLGLSAGGFALKLAYGKLKERRFYIIGLALAASTFVTLGALGGMGILSASQLGWGVVGTSFAAAPVKILFLGMNIKKRAADLYEV